MELTTPRIIIFQKQGKYDRILCIAGQLAAASGEESGGAGGIKQYGKMR